MVQQRRVSKSCNNISSDSCTQRRHRTYSHQSHGAFPQSRLLGLGMASSWQRGSQRGQRGEKGSYILWPSSLIAHRVDTRRYGVGRGLVNHLAKIICSSMHFPLSEQSIYPEWASPRSRGCQPRSSSTRGQWRGRVWGSASSTSPPRPCPAPRPGGVTPPSSRPRTPRTLPTGSPRTSRSKATRRAAAIWSTSTDLLAPTPRAARARTTPCHTPSGQTRRRRGFK